MAIRIERSSLLSTSNYVRQRAEWREKVIPFKKLRTLILSTNARLLFENELTVRYQLQEMIRVDKSLETDPLTDELETYNALIPSDSSLKATLMFEFVDSGIRQSKLAQMQGVEKHVWIQVDDCEKVYATPCGHLGEQDADRTASVHFLSFDLDQESRAVFLAGHPVAMGVDHPAFQHTIYEIAPELQAMLIEDLRSK